MRYDEEQHQAALWQWVRTQWFWPFFFHVPNERINRREAHRLWRLGVRSGVPDNFIMIPKNNYAGLALELKRPGDKLTGASPGRTKIEQVIFAKMLAATGWYVALAYGWEDAKVTINEYLAGHHRRDPVPGMIAEGIAKQLAAELTIAAEQRRKRGKL